MMYDPFENLWKVGLTQKTVEGGWPAEWHAERPNLEDGKLKVVARLGDFSGHFGMRSLGPVPVLRRVLPQRLDTIRLLMVKTWRIRKTRMRPLRGTSRTRTRKHKGRRCKSSCWKDMFCSTERKFK